MSSGRFFQSFRIAQTQSRELDKAEMHLTETVFKESSGGKDYLNPEDVKVAIMELFGHKVSKVEVLQMIHTYGSSQGADGQEIGLSLAQFKEAVKSKFAAIDEDEKIRNTFLAFDRKCRGFLTVDDVKAVFSQVCPHFAEHRVELAFKELDRDGDGRISYKDFDFMMKFDNWS